MDNVIFFSITVKPALAVALSDLRLKRVGAKNISFVFSPIQANKKIGYKKLKQNQAKKAHLLATPEQCCQVILTAYIAKVGLKEGFHAHVFLVKTKKPVIPRN